PPSPGHCGPTQLSLACLFSAAASRARSQDETRAACLGPQPALVSSSSSRHVTLRPPWGLGPGALGHFQPWPPEWALHAPGSAPPSPVGSDLAQHVQTQATPGRPSPCLGQSGMQEDGPTHKPLPHGSARAELGLLAGWRCAPQTYTFMGHQLCGWQAFVPATLRQGNAVWGFTPTQR
ncbi:hypothetical protein MC885_015865, partial [Smutsia gigantea]